MFGAVLGGWLADTYSWRAAFVVFGTAGLLLAPIVRLAIREPPRGHSEPLATMLDASAAPPSTLQVATSLLRSPAFRHLCAGMTLAGVANYGINTFSAAYFVRQFDVSYRAQIDELKDGRGRSRCG